MDTTRPSHLGTTVRQRRRWLLAVGLALPLLALLSLAALDVAAVDRTTGGYEPPYEDWVGEPIDWERDVEKTSNGFVRRGRILDVHTDCTTGMISIRVLGIVGFDHREVSDRALAIHAPDAACRDHGFEPAFGREGH